MSQEAFAATDETLPPGQTSHDRAVRAAPTSAQGTAVSGRPGIANVHLTAGRVRAMPLFKRGRSEPNPSDLQQRLVGKWFGRVAGEPAALEIRLDGRMAYVVTSGGKQQTMLLTWRVDGEELVTDQPSAPKAERTRFRFEGRSLILAFGGVESRFER